MKKRVESLLKANGIEVALEEREVTKNGVIHHGFSVDRGEGSSTRLCPVVYYEPDDTPEMVASRIKEALEMRPEFDIEDIMSGKAFRENAYVALVKRGGSSPEVLTRSYLNTDLVMRVRVKNRKGDCVGTILVTDQCLEAAGLTKSQAWDIAMANSKDMVEILPITDIISKMDPGLEGMFPPVPKEEMFYVMTYDGELPGGAAAFIFNDIISKFCADEGIDELYIVPSSTEEMLLLDAKRGSSPKDLLELNAEITSEAVDATMQMESVIYLYSADTKEITTVQIGEEA